MKSTLLLLLVLLSVATSYAQRIVQMKNLWTKPQVHVIFEGYIVSFTIKDIDKALVLLEQSGDSTFGIQYGFDTTEEYSIELYSGTRMEYHDGLQPLMQQGVGAFLLSLGHAYIKDPNGKEVKEVSMNIIPPIGDEQYVFILFYDPDTGNRVFSGKMLAAMYYKALSLD